MFTNMLKTIKYENLKSFSHSLCPIAFFDPWKNTGTLELHTSDWSIVGSSLILCSDLIYFFFLVDFFVIFSFWDFLESFGKCKPDSIQLRTLSHTFQILYISMSNRNAHLNLFRVGLFRMKMHAKLSVRKKILIVLKMAKKVLNLITKVAQKKDVIWYFA